MNKQRIAIIGGGIAGMVAAKEINRSMPNAEIMIYERSKTLGGRASTIQKDAFYLNQGAHALYNSGTLNKYLQELGIVLPGGPSPQANSQVYVDGTLKPFPTLDLPIVDPAEVMDVPLKDWLEAQFDDSVSVKVFEALTRLGTYSNAPETMSAGTAIQQLIMSQDGVKYLDFGWQNIIAALQESLTGPVTFRLDGEVSSVREVMSDCGPAVAVTAGGYTDIFDFAVMALPPALVEKLAPGALPQGFSQTLVNAKIACFDICLRELPNWNNTFVLGLDEPLYYSVHSATAKLTHGDGIVLHMGYYLKHEEHGTQEHLKLMTDLLDKLQPGWQDQLVYKRFLPNMVASYATPLASRNGLGGLPTPKLPGASRILAAGDWVGTGHFLADASAASALEAAHLVVEMSALVERRSSVMAA
jgi:predicted NAD/FAD-dependent oxidoreductase